MPVYIVRAGEHGPVKIGYAAHVPSRLVKMQADNHERLRLLRILEGARREEASLHALFKDSHLHGEWHAYSERMLGNVGLRDLPIVQADIWDKSDTGGAPTCHREVIRALGGPAEIARQLGIWKPSPPTLHWIRRGIPPRYLPLVADLLEARGRPITMEALATMEGGPAFGVPI